MKKNIYIAIIAFLFFISAYVIYTVQIYNNAPLFNTDEAYWISTAKIIPVLASHRTEDPFWQEYYGFTNFNGAKYIYGLGLALFHHSESEIAEAGVAPHTYYKWVDFDGKIFPQDHVLYPLLRDARVISAFFVSLSIAVFILATYLLFQSLWPSLAAGIFFTLHPIPYYVATHAFSDSFLLFFICLSLLFTLSFLKTCLTQKPITFSALLCGGCIFGYMMSIKINGILFLFSFSFVLLFMYLLHPKTKTIWPFLTSVVSITVISFFFFLLLHPNLFFYPAYTFRQMIQDRIAITDYHVALYSVKNPSHVTLSIPSKIQSLINYCFPLWFVIPFLIGVGTFLYQWMTHALKKIPVYPYMLLFGFVVLNGILSYVVFDEIRYFLPLLPFLIFISVGWTGNLYVFIRTVLNRFSKV